MGKVISISSLKGGVGKTQLAFELSAWFSLYGKKVLALDLDQQANLSTLLLGGANPSGRTLPDILLAGDGIRTSDINSRHLDRDGHVVDFVCSNIRLGRIEGHLPANVKKDFCIVNALNGVRGMYDYIVVDTAPSLDVLGVAALVAADELVVPCTPDRMSVAGVESLLRMAMTIKHVSKLNPRLFLRAIVVSRYKPTISSLFNTTALTARYRGIVMKPFVRECTRVQQAVNKGLPVVIYDSDCTSASDYGCVFGHLMCDGL